MKIDPRYLDGTYFNNNPTWDIEDSPWKAAVVLKSIDPIKNSLQSICDVGCGSGEVLRILKRSLPSCSFAGFDISPQLTKFWPSDDDICYKLCDIIRTDLGFDLIMCLDVIEHLRDPFTFLEELSSHGRYFLSHIPLDLSCSSLLRGYPLLNVQSSVGHLHFYTPSLAEKLISDSGYTVISTSFTDAYRTMPNRSMPTRFLSIPRYLLSLFSRSLSSSLLGGQSLVILAMPNSDKNLNPA